MEESLYGDDNVLFQKMSISDDSIRLQDGYKNSEEMETDTGPFTSLEDQGIKSLDEAVESLTAFLSIELASWINKSTKLPNSDVFVKQIFQKLVENAIDEQCGQFPTNLWAELTRRIQTEAKEKWVHILPVVIKMVSMYKTKLGVKLDIHVCLPEDDFNKVTKELLTKLLDGVNDTFTREVISRTCTHITKQHQSRNLWVLQNQGRIESKVQEIVQDYEKEMAGVLSANHTGKKKIMSSHANLAEKCVGILQNEFHGSPEAGKMIVISYTTKLKGLLNSKYDQIVGKLKSKTPEPSPKQVGAFTQGMPFVSGKEKKPKHVTDDTSKGRSKRKPELFYNVREKEDDEKPTRLGDSPIYYFESKMLASGRSATVYEGLFGDGIRKRVPAAIKRFEWKDMKLFKNELKICDEISEGTHKDSVNVVKLLACVKWKTEHSCQYYLATDLADSDLGKKVLELKEYPESQITTQDRFQKLVGYIHDAAKGLQWLHTKNIIHRDIKPQNILIYSYFYADKIREIAKLTDFGISRIAIDPVVGAETMPGGTDEWAAPEVLKAKTTSERVQNTKSQDIFSLGLTCHFTLSLGEHPFGKSEKHGRMTAWNIYDDLVAPSSLPKSHFAANDMIQAMIQRNPTNRPDISNVLQHPLFWDIERSLSFLREFAIKFYEKKDPDIKQFRSSIDQAYVKWYEENVPLANSGTELPEKFDWKKMMCGEKLVGLMKTKVNKIKKTYDESSLMFLLELIRDKSVHCGDMSETLLTDQHFGQNGAFCKTKYGQYFLETFPDILIFLVNLVHSSPVDGNAGLNQLRKEYF